MHSIIDHLKQRRSIYNLNNNLPVSKEEVISVIEQATEHTPDAFNMKSARVVVLLDSKHQELWQLVDEAYQGKINREKLQGFSRAKGTILYFIDNDVVQKLQQQFPLYSDNFPIWAEQANGMLQLAIWTSLRSLEVGANIQHYNPIIDDAVKSKFSVPKSYRLVAQMPFGGIVELPQAKEVEDIKQRVSVIE